MVPLLDRTDQYGKTVLHLAVEAVAKDHSSSVEYEEVIAQLERQGDDETVRVVKQGPREGSGDDEAALFEKLAIGGAGERAVAHDDGGDNSSDEEEGEEGDGRLRDTACDANVFVQRQGTRTRAVVKVHMPHLSRPPTHLFVSPCAALPPILSLNTLNPSFLALQWLLAQKPELVIRANKVACSATARSAPSSNLNLLVSKPPRGKHFGEECSNCH